MQTLRMLRRTGPDTFVGTFADESGASTDVEFTVTRDSEIPLVESDLGTRLAWSGAAESLRAVFAAVQAFDLAGEHGLLDEEPA